MRFLPLAGALALTLSLVACSTHDAEQPDQSEAAIQGGYAWGGDYAVGMLSFNGGAGVCTGTLIASNIVLTAGHCVQGKSLEAFYFGEGEALEGSPETPPLGIPSNMTRYEIDAFAIYPSFDVGTMSFCPTPTGDVALLRLKDAPRWFPPRPILQSWESNRIRVGQTCWAVGYGRHDENGRVTAKKKRSAEVIVYDITPDGFGVVPADNYTGGLPDTGDSGGPLLCFTSHEVVAGVVSCHNGSPQRDEYYARVDRDVSRWIADALVRFPETIDCPPTLTYRCNGETLEYCANHQWRPIQPCTGAQHCTLGGCR